MARDEPKRAAAIIEKLSIPEVERVKIGKILGID
jgi:hypothetical protein